MKKIIVFLIMISIITVYALSNNFNIDTSKLSFVNDSKKGNIVNDFNKEYELKYSIKEDKQDEKEKLKKIAKRTTYLLLGDINNINETSEHFYNRKHEFYSSRYNTSDEDKYSSIANFAIPQTFNQANELKLIYNSFGDIQVEIKDDIAIVIVHLPNVKGKEQNKDNPMKYDEVVSNFTMYYAYHKDKDIYMVKTH